ncbi:hypothetical protein VNO80_25108 [Phaseolus coccineus]|uniref:N-acetyltransferase domain-containing protein n=1 Tax=Phaseolus coccineus TaxID=3886 RepID=A0AAN9LTP3_PHACN
MANVAILELNRNCAKTVEEIVKLERKFFPKHESLASFFHDELKKNSGLLYLHVDCELAGYVMYSWPSALYASITKLAVKEQWRGHGHGETLLKAALEKCRTRKVSRIMLHVDPLRTPADIESKLKRLKYSKVDEFVDDMASVFFYPLGYPPRSEIHKIATTITQTFELTWKTMKKRWIGEENL